MYDDSLPPSLNHASVPQPVHLELCLALTYSAARDICQFMGDRSGNHSFIEDEDAVERAERELSLWFDQNAPYLTYLANSGQGRDGDQLVELMFPVHEELESNIQLSRMLHGRTLILTGIDKEQNSYFHTGKPDSVFLIIRANVVQLPDKFDGHGRVRGLARVVTTNPQSLANPGMPPALLEQLRRQPRVNTRREVIQKRLSDWEHYLEILENQARKKQFDVAYLRYRITDRHRQINLSLDRSDRDLPWDKIRGAIGQIVHLNEHMEILSGDTSESISSPTSDYDVDDIELGTIEEVTGAGILRIRLDEDLAYDLQEGKVKLPSTGVLRNKAFGDTAIIRRMKWGLGQLGKSGARNPRLQDFLFDPREARLNDGSPITIARDQLLQGDIASNEGQLAAVTGALNAPDLYLIQGPPGTGKTTVIAELCYQVAIRGKRTLVASQANLAVDNALSRLVHHPSIRALRRGRADRVEEEGQQFLEHQVIETWLTNTAQSCREDFERRRTRVETFQQLVDNTPRAMEFLALTHTFYVEREKINRQTKYLEIEMIEITGELDSIEANLPNYTDAVASLIALIDTWRFRESQTDQLVGGSLDKNPIERELAKHRSLVDLDVRINRLVSELKSWLPPGVLPPVHLFLFSLDFDTIASCLERARWANYQYEDVRIRIGEADSLLQFIGSTAQDWYETKRLYAESEETWLESDSTQQRVNGLILEITRKNDEYQSDLKAWEDARSETEPLLKDIANWLSSVVETDIPYSFDSAPRALWNPTRERCWNILLALPDWQDVDAAIQRLRRARREASEVEKIVDRPKEISGQLVFKCPAQEINRATLEGRKWESTILGNLVSRDASGAYHVSPDANIALDSLERDLIDRHESYSWIARLFGAERRRIRDNARWVAALRALSSDLSSRLDVLAAEITILDAEARKSVRNMEDRVGGTLPGRLTAEIETSSRVIAEQRGKIEDAQKIGKVASEAHRSAEQHMQAAADDLNSLGSVLYDASAKLPNLPLFSKIARHVSEIERHEEDAWQVVWHSDLETLKNHQIALATAARELDVEGALLQVVAAAEAQTDTLRKKRQDLLEQREDVQREIATQNDALQALRAGFMPHAAWWMKMHDAVPLSLRPEARSTIVHPDYVKDLLSTSDLWPEELYSAKTYLVRCELLVNDWIKRIEASTEKDRSDLRHIYIENANVIGITCGQAGTKYFTQEYGEFDYVIIDEVSKATPPELLLPMLMANKVVLVGDSRQLPPMIGPNTLTDLAQEMGVAEFDIQHIKRSLFRELFEKSPDELRSWLTYQYRMHPQIMDAINQFYERKLESRIKDPDRTRAHGCHPVIDASHHLVWIETPNQQRFFEDRQGTGTSIRNASELEIIESVVTQLNEIIGRRQPGALPKEVGVITFYAAQARELRHRLLDRPQDERFDNLKIRVGTVDRFQGMERPIIIASLVRNNDEGKIGFAREPERINVAFSRAQELLVIVGCKDLFCRLSRDKQAAARYARVADVVRRSGGQLDFSAFLNY